MDQYIKNKAAYNSIIFQTGGRNEKTVNKNQEKKLVSLKNKCRSLPKNVLIKTVTGQSLNKKNKHLTKQQLCAKIFRSISDEKDEHVPQNDSLTAWANQGVEKYGLTVGDIMGMKFGDSIKVILMDRNSGENIPGKIGSKFKPTEHGFSYATYIHGENLSGMLHFDNLDLVHIPFEWEINRTAIGDKNAFWGPLGGCGLCMGKKNKEKNIQAVDLDKNILVGWRRPSI